MKRLSLIVALLLACLSAFSSIYQNQFTTTNDTGIATSPTAIASVGITNGNLTAPSGLTVGTPLAPLITIPPAAGIIYIGNPNGPSVYPWIDITNGNNGSISFNSPLGYQFNGGQLNGNGGGLTNLSPAAISGGLTNFNTFQFDAGGDSEMQTNPSCSLSIAQQLVASFGWTLGTNSAVGGTTETAAYNSLTGMQPWWPATLGPRKVYVVCTDKNSMQGITAAQSNSIGSAILVNNTNIIQKAQAAKYDIVWIDQPYTVPVGIWTNIEPCRQFVNSAMDSMTNYPGVLAVIHFDSIVPPNTLTNANGSYNTNVTLDGLHFTNQVTWAVASNINLAISKSRFQTLSSSEHPSYSAQLPATNYTGSAIWYDHNGGGANETFVIGDPTGASVIENSWGGDTSSFWILGTGFVASRDLTSAGAGTWGFYFLNAAKNHGVSLLPNNDIIFIGGTNNASTGNEIPYFQGLDVRGGVDYLALNRLAFTNNMLLGQWLVQGVANANNELAFISANSEVDFLTNGGVTIPGALTVGSVSGNGSGLTSLNAITNNATNITFNAAAATSALTLNQAGSSQSSVISMTGAGVGFGFTMNGTGTSGQYTGMTIQKSAVEKIFIGRDGTDGSDDMIVRMTSSVNPFKIISAGAVNNAMVLSGGTLTVSNYSGGGSGITNGFAGIFTYTNYIVGTAYTNTSTRSALVSVNCRCNPTTTASAMFAISTSTTGATFITNAIAGLEADTIFTTAPHSWYQQTAIVPSGGIWKVVDISGDSAFVTTNCYWQTLQ